MSSNIFCLKSGLIKRYSAHDDAWIWSVYIKESNPILTSLAEQPYHHEWSYFYLKYNEHHHEVDEDLQEY